jgi:glycine cleavage system H protein
MTVLLVLVTFIVFLVIDAVLNRKKVPAVQMEVPAGVMAESAEVVGGFHWPDALKYHPGHTWVAHERKNVLRVGADEFAAAVAGPLDAVELPKPGTWVRQGQKIIGLMRSGEKIELVSPVEGEVVEVNADVQKDPGSLRSDPYGKGWLFAVFSPDEEGTSRNLLPTNLARAWMRQTVDRLYSLQPQLAGATAADGGVPVENLAAALPGLTAKQLTDEFFLN